MREIKVLHTTSERIRPCRKIRNTEMRNNEMRNQNQIRIKAPSRIKIKISATNRIRIRAPNRTKMKIN